MPVEAIKALSTGPALSQIAGLIRVVYVAREPAVSWRVTAGNGRILGVSIAAFATRDDAATDLRDAQSRLIELVPSYSHPRSGVGWTWVAGRPDGTPVAQCARNYERRATCVTGYERFISALKYVVVEPGTEDQPNLPLT